MGDAMPYTTPLMRLQDPTQTKVLLITLAEPTPVTEAEVLQQDLERAGIHPWAWVINNSLLAARPGSPFLRVRANNEGDQVTRVETLTDRVAIVPLMSEEPVGLERLGSLLTGQVVPA
jgi:arsenite-transporting ATPase